MDHPEITVTMPAYNRAGLISRAIESVQSQTLSEWELVIVDDGSTDGTGNEGRGEGAIVLTHPRNRGKGAALRAGIARAYADGAEVIVTLDADGQNDPADIPALLDELARSDAAAVAGYRAARQDTAWKRLQSRIANGVRNRLNDETIRDTGCSLKAFRADAVRDLPLFTGMHRFLPTLVKMRGGAVAEVPVRHRPRRFGTTKYGMWNRVFRSLTDALAVRWMQRRVLRYRVTEDLP